MGVFDNITAAPAAPAKGVFSAVPAVAPAAKTSGGVFANVTSKPVVAPASAPAPAGQYFEAKEPTGTFIGISDQKDPFSGKPFLAYRLPGATSTTTDTTRVAPANNPEVAAPQPKTAFQNPRMPESASQAIRANEGATSDEQLDHRMAITLGGSNDPSNLKLISTKDNQAASSGEGAMTQSIADGKMSLFDAQLAEAKAKGLPVPFTDQPAQPGSLWDKLTKGASDLVGVGKEIAADVGSEIIKLGVGTQGQTNPEGAANLQALSAHLDPILASLGKQGDALTAMKNDLDNTKVDNTNQASVDAFNQKVNAFNSALQDYNIKSPEGQKLADLFNTTLDSYNKSVIAPSGAYGLWSTFLSDKVLTPYLTATVAAGNAAADVTENLSNPDGTMKSINKIDWASATANELKFLAAGAGAIANPAMVPYTVANAVPVVGHVLDPVNWLIGKGGDAVGNTGEFLLSPAINKLPISQDDKDQLNSAIKDVGSTIGQFAVGAYLFGRAGKAVEMKGNPLANFKDLTLGDAKDLVDQTKKFADQVKARLPQNLQEAQRGFAKIPGVKDKAAAAAPEEEPPADDSKDTEKMPAELQPLVEEAKKFASADEFQKALQNQKNILETIQKENPESTRVGSAIKIMEAKIEAATPDFFDKATKETPAKPAAVKEKAPVSTQQGIPRPPRGSALIDLALQQKTPHDFYLALTDSERQQVINTIDPDGTGATAESAAHAFYAAAKENIAPRDTELPSQSVQGGIDTGTGAKSIKQVIEQRSTQTEKGPALKGHNPSGPLPQRNQSYDPVIEEHNGGVKPPENKGGMEPPEVDWSKGKEIAAIRQSTDTLERTFEKIFPKEEADKLNEFLTEANRHNEAEKVRFVDTVRKETQQKVVKELGIKPATVKSAWVQRLGEGRISLEELKREQPADWQNIAKASDFFRGKYDSLIDMWNKEREKAGLKPINKRPNYFRHFIDLTSFANMYGLDFKESGLPTAISGMTEYFRSQSPWSNAAMRRLGSTTTDDAVGGFDNYLDSAARAIFHTDTVQRGRLVDKYLRNAADANAHAAQDIRDSGEDKETPPPINLPRLASTLKQWTDTVSGKQNIFDRSLESMVGRPALAVMRAITRQFGLNVIGGNVGAAVTHAIPMVYTLATVDKGAAFHGLYGTLTSPLLENFRKIDGIQSDFLTRRFGKEEIQPTLGEKTAAVISAPFHWVDQFISRFAVESKYHEGIAKGMTPPDAMKAADNYASRVIGDRSAGNLPPIMSTKTLGWLTQFQIEVNDNLRVLMHDIPRWEGGNVPKIANRFVQFAVYSYLFNQTMQYIKGSGKGLDPIDMGLTLAGLNDEGHDQTLSNRLSSVGADLLKELPFTSVPTGGQIPALQPLQQAITDATNGAPLKALQGVLASFASPVGGGQQLQKSLTAIQAWRQGYVTDSRGNITATVPHTIPTLAQGVLFGKSAFDSVKKANSEISNLDATLKEGQAASKLKNTQADNIWAQLKTMPADQAKTQLEQIATSDPDMAKRVIASAKADAAGITKQDTLLKTLGVTNGARADYIANQLKEMSTDAEKKAYLSDLADKKILTAAVLAQVAALLKK